VTEKGLVPGQAPTPSDGTKTVEFGKEDLILALIIAILLIGWATGQITIQQLLAYLGVSTTGGVWGLIGGASSDK
jgi:hypothetical protein